MIEAWHVVLSRPLDNRHVEFNDCDSYKAAFRDTDPDVPDDGGVIREQIKVCSGAELAARPCRPVAR